MTRKYFSLSLLSAFLLVFCSPKFSFGFLAWVALIPLLAVLQDAKSHGRALLGGFITGILFFGISLHWLTEVSVFGWIFVVFLETFFFLFFCLAVYEGRNISTPILKSLWIALAWTSTEFIRSEFPIFGLGWNLLAYSQSNYSWILQSANAVGAYGLGFVIAFVNANLLQLFFPSPLSSPQRGEENKEKFSLSKVRNTKKSPLPQGEGYLPAVRLPSVGQGQAGVRGNLIFSLLIILILLVAHGFYHVRREIHPIKNVRIAVVQGNIPQDIKWETEAREKILQIYMKLTELSFLDQADLVIWPEAAFPGYFNRDLMANQVLDLIKKYEVPVLVGSPHLEHGITAFNSAYLVESDGEVKARYDKQHLVPFGEYVPLKLIFGWLAPLAYTLGVSDFQAGHEPVVFHLEDNPLAFSALICFEDVFPNLARKSVDRGAQMLTVITNDAWFGQTAAPYQHLEASIFRAVENGVPVVRAANTGISAFISSKGKVIDRVRDPATGKDIFVTGRKTLDLPIDHHPTLYRCAGWIFPYVAFGVFVIIPFSGRGRISLAFRRSLPGKRLR